MPGAMILVIEDDALNRELAVDLLESSGFVVSEADSAENGIDIARSALPDLILMDIALPLMDGLQATKILRSDPRTAHIAIVALTARAMEGDKERAMAAGCVGYITKPIDTRSFQRTISEYLAGPPAPAIPECNR